MYYLHENGYENIDINPEKVLFDSFLYPKISGFGLFHHYPKSLDKLFPSQKTMPIGCPIHSVPELIIDENWEIFQFGVLAYEILTLKNLNDSRNMNFSELSKIFLYGHAPKFPDDTNPKMKILISKCFNKKDKNRPSFKEIFETLSKDFSYSNDDLDEDEINDYIESLKLSEK